MAVATSGTTARRGVNTMVYDEAEIRRVARRGFALARARKISPDIGLINYQEPLRELEALYRARVAQVA